MDIWHLKSAQPWGPSGASQRNFLYQKQNIYFMDNHGLALWCWAQEIKKDPQVPILFLHIDAHEDAATTIGAKWDKLNCDIRDLNLNDFLHLHDDEFNIPLIRWDNYLPLFEQLYRSQIKRSYGCTHGIGLKFNFNQRSELFRLLKDMDHWFQGHSGGEAKWIINLDLDFFFTSLPHKICWTSESYLEQFKKLLDQLQNNNELLALTVALSPECCGGVGPAKNLAVNLFPQEFPKF